MQLKKVVWAPLAKSFYLRLLGRQRQAIDALIRGLTEADMPGADFIQIEDYPDYWFSRTDLDLVLVIQQRGETYEISDVTSWAEIEAIPLPEPEPEAETIEAAPPIPTARLRRPA
jgi:hypothetical protein